MKKITTDMVFSVDRGTDEQLAETLKIFEKNNLKWCSVQWSLKDAIAMCGSVICYEYGSLMNCRAYRGQHYTPEQFHAEFGESKPLGLSLDPKDYEGRKLDRVKDAFRCPVDSYLPIVRWDDRDCLVEILALNVFDHGNTVWDNYATIPGYEIPDEWRTYKEPAAPAKPRQMTRGEALRAQMTGVLEIVSGEMHASGIFLCTDDNRDDPMSDDCRCRKWGESEWQTLTIDMLPEAWGVK